MSEAPKGPPPFHLACSDLCRRQLQFTLEQAAAKGRLEEFVNAARGINSRLRWVHLDFGEPTLEYVHPGLQEYVGTVPPFVVQYSVDEVRRIVYVNVPFKLLPNCGL